MFLKKSLFILLIISSNVFSQTNPAITSWLINTTGQTGFAGIETNVLQVQYSTTSAYISTKDIADWIPVGYNWPSNPWFAQDMSYTFRIRLNPTQNNGVLKKPPYGHIGLWTNGVSIYNPLDAKSYNNDTTWFQNAFYWEHLLAETFDPCFGHPNQSHEYHLHVSPTCLYNDSDSTQHAPLIGFAFDGFPIYGAYGFTNTNGTGPIKRMHSSYRLRNIIDRTVLPDGTVLSPSLYGPSLATVLLGGYQEDYEYVPGLGDLDEHNGRFCVTPDYPGGIYAYFVTLDDSLIPVYPYVIGQTFYGTVIPGDGNMGPNSGYVIISEPVTNYVPASAVLENKSEHLNLEVFPNPVSDQLNFKLSSDISGNKFLGEIYDRRGSLIKSGDVITNKPYSFNARDLKQGVYFLKVTSGKQTLTAKFSVIK